MSDEEKKLCDLCQLTVEISGFTLKTKTGEKNFCCEGCKGIYEMLNESDVLPQWHLRIVLGVVKNEAST